MQYLGSRTHFGRIALLWLGNANLNWTSVSPDGPAPSPAPDTSSSGPCPPPPPAWLVHLPGLSRYRTFLYWRGKPCKNAAILSSCALAR
ncbi:hypothetical protein GJAV_G00224220 [Gymnothorax javanicus]|nr:hypothetical protein GJAV_G00224220 [Gymnothorax javanicus]